MRALGLSRAVKNVVSFAVNRTWIPGTFGHLPMPHLKSTFEEIWRSQPKVMERTSRSRFRIDDGVNHWLASAWNVVSGRFSPANEKRRGEFVTFDERTLADVCDLVRKQKCPQLCLNDKGSDVTPERCFDEIAGAFESILPEKSQFEK